METREHVLTREKSGAPADPSEGARPLRRQLATPGITTRRGSVGQLATPGAHAPGRGSVLALRRAGRELHELAPSDAARARAPCSSNAARARERRAGSASSARRDGGSRGLTRATGTRATASSRPSDAVRARAPCSSNAARARECHEDTARPRCAQHDNASSDGSEKGGRGAPCSETRTSRDASEREDPPRAVEPSDDERADNLPRASPPGASSAPSRLPPPRGPPPPAGWRRSERHPGCAALIDATTFFWSALSKSESRSWLNMQSLPNAHLTPVVGSRYATQHGRAFWPFWPATL